MTAPAAPGSTAERFVDLHMHSTASDGLLAPAAVVAAARAAGLVAIALTDHDTLEGVPEARAAGEALGVRVVAGVELSAHEGDRELHVLGLHLTRLAGLEDRLVALRATRRTRAAQIVEKLRALGFPIELDAVWREAGEGAVGRPHVARVLIANGWAKDHRDAFDRLIGSGRPAYVPKQRLPLSEAVQMLHEAGGLALIAHPGSDGSRSRLETLKRIGFDGVEVRHPSHSVEDIARLGTLADYLGLVPSGGSDWHGAGDGPRTIGNMRVPYAWLERQDALVRERHTSERVA
ncbi:MAG TPA: PHP domain-containing protein [Gemmatimonadaceae bacterium]|nr:PHP domain-containing protein [Gemmatimonadaceae bacterium]